MIARRAFLASLAAGLLAGERAAATEPGRTLHRIGFVGNSTAALESNLVEPWRQGLREVGYVEGRDIVVEGGGRFLPAAHLRPTNFWIAALSGTSLSQ